MRETIVASFRPNHSANEVDGFGCAIFEIGQRLRQRTSSRGIVTAVEPEFTIATKQFRQRTRIEALHASRPFCGK